MSFFPYYPPQATIPGMYWVWSPYFATPWLPPQYASLSPALPTLPLPAPPTIPPLTNVTPAPPYKAPATHTPPEVKSTKKPKRIPGQVTDLPWIDPLISFSPSPDAFPPFAWDLADDPTLLLVGRHSVRQNPAVRASSSAAALAIRSITLLFPRLPPVEVIVLPTYPCAFTTPADVLLALYRALREPIPEHVLAVLGRDQRAELRRNARTRSAARGKTADGSAIKIDFLAKRRRFLGLRPARQVEVPFGKDSRQVFVVEVGSVDA